MYYTEVITFPESSPCIFMDFHIIVLSIFINTNTHSVLPSWSFANTGKITGLNVSILYLIKWLLRKMFMSRIIVKYQSRNDVTPPPTHTHRMTRRVYRDPILRVTWKTGKRRDVTWKLLQSLDNYRT